MSEEVTDQSSWTPKVEKLLQEWHRRVYAAQTAYYEEAERLRRRNYQLGIPVVIVSSLVGTAVFSDVAKDGNIRWFVGSVSILAAVLASLQTFLKFGENATLHGAAADWFSAIRRDIEQVLALPPNMRGKPKACLDGVRQEMNRAGQKSPELSERLWKRVAHRFGVEEPPYSLQRRQGESGVFEDPEPSGADFRPKVKRKHFRESH
jgi:hypothetical protein